MKHIYKILFGFLVVIELILLITLFVSLSQKNPLFYPKYRILACISSFKRPIFVSGQVLRLFNQTYPVDVSLSIKGVPADFVQNVLSSEWKPWIDSGRLILRIDTNKDQFSNFLDTVRDIDLSQYDYFCKIDDDDWYGPDYFKHVNEWLHKDKNIVLSLTTRYLSIRNNTHGVAVSFNKSNLFGPTMCFSREVIKAALEIEKNPNIATRYLPGHPLQSYRKTREDNYLHRLAQVIGFVQKRKTPFFDLSYGQQYPSVLRGGGYLP